MLRRGKYWKKAKVRSSMCVCMCAFMYIVHCTQAFNLEDHAQNMLKAKNDSPETPVAEGITLCTNYSV